jgi:hypothetical protein
MYSWPSCRLTQTPTPSLNGFRITVRVPSIRPIAVFALPTAAGGKWLSWASPRGARTCSELEVQQTRGDCHNRPHAPRDGDWASCLLESQSSSHVGRHGQRQGWRLRTHPVTSPYRPLMPARVRTRVSTRTSGTHLLVASVRGKLVVDRTQQRGHMPRLPRWVRSLLAR